MTATQCLAMERDVEGHGEVQSAFRCGMQAGHAGPHVCECECGHEWTADVENWPLAGRLVLYRGNTSNWYRSLTASKHGQHRYDARRNIRKAPDFDKGDTAGATAVPERGLRASYIIFAPDDANEDPHTYAPPVNGLPVKKIRKTRKRK